MRRSAFVIALLAVGLIVAAGLPRPRPRWPLAQGSLRISAGSSLTLPFITELDMPHMLEFEFPRTPQSVALLPSLQSDTPPLYFSWQVLFDAGAKSGDTKGPLTEFGTADTVGLITSGFVLPPDSKAQVVVTVARVPSPNPVAAVTVRVIPHPGKAKSLFVTLAIHGLLRTLSFVLFALALLLFVAATVRTHRQHRT